MGKMEKSIKSEIERLSKREVRKFSLPLGQDVRQLKVTVSKLRKTVSILERFVAQKQKETVKREIPLEAQPEEIKKARFSPRLIRSLRKKMKVTQKELAMLAGVTVGAVHQWETGKFQPAKDKKSKLVALRKLTRQDIKKLLAEKKAK